MSTTVPLASDRCWQLYETMPAIAWIVGSIKRFLPVANNPRRKYIEYRSKKYARYAVSSLAGNILFAVSERKESGRFNVSRHFYFSSLNFIRYFVINAWHDKILTEQILMEINKQQVCHFEQIMVKRHWRCSKKFNRLNLFYKALSTVITSHIFIEIIWI